MYSTKKAMVFGSLGLALGYFCHRLVLLYDSLPNQPPLEKIAFLLDKSQDLVFVPLWNFSFTGRSFVAFLLGFLTMLLVYLYMVTGQKVYREGAEYGSARFGTAKEKKVFHQSQSL